MPSGFALRVNGSCPSGNVDCGVTVEPYRACCPHGQLCPAPQYNVVCCPTTENCTMSLLRHDPPPCANPSWDLYDNGGYFCCESGHTGYASTQNSDGCASPGYKFQQDEELLQLISLGAVTTSSLTTATSSSIRTTSEESMTRTTISSSSRASRAITSNTSSSEGPIITSWLSNPNLAPETGLTVSAKIGAGVGVGLGVPVAIAVIVGIIFSVKRKRKLSRSRNSEPPLELPPEYIKAEIDSEPRGARKAEIDGWERVELDSRERTELHGNHRLEMEG